jgi:hypothetical protein
MVGSGNGWMGQCCVVWLDVKQLVMRTETTPEEDLVNHCACMCLSCLSLQLLCCFSIPKFGRLFTPECQLSVSGGLRCGDLGVSKLL